MMTPLVRALVDAKASVRMTALALTLSVAGGVMLPGLVLAQTQTGAAVSQAPVIPAVADRPAVDCIALPSPELDWSLAQQRLAQCNRDFRLALQSVRAAQADVQIAGQRPNPTLSTGVGQYSTTVGAGAGGPFDKQVDWLARLDQPIERGNKRDLRVQTASQSLRAAGWSAADMLRQQQLALANAWIDLWGAQEKSRLQRELTALYRNTFDSAQRRLKAGDIAASDVARIDLDLQRAETDRIAANSELVRARFILASLLAMEPQAPQLKVVSPWPASDPASTTVIPAGEAERPDLQAARALQAAADSQAELARSLQTRDISIGLQVDRFAPPSGFGTTLGAYVSIPLFVNHRYEGELARAEADRDFAAAARARLEQQARADQQRLLEARIGARLRRERLEREALPVAEKVVTNADLAYRKGAGNVLELIDALRQLRALQLEALAVRLDEDRADAAARAEMLTTTAAADPIFGESLRLSQPLPVSVK
jgi:cobalt-zinc-cadmium efflux system outer membrane protein